jgi:hypothetical protein
MVGALKFFIAIILNLERLKDTYFF